MGCPPRPRPRECDDGRHGAPRRQANLANLAKDMARGHVNAHDHESDDHHPAPNHHADARGQSEPDDCARNPPSHEILPRKPT